MSERDQVRLMAIPRLIRPEGIEGHARNGRISSLLACYYQHVGAPVERFRLTFQFLSLGIQLRPIGPEGPLFATPLAGQLRLVKNLLQAVLNAPRLNSEIPSTPVAQHDLLQNILSRARTVNFRRLPSGNQYVIYFLDISMRRTDEAAMAEFFNEKGELFGRTFGDDWLPPQWSA